MMGLVQCLLSMLPSLPLHRPSPGSARLPRSFRRIAIFTSASGSQGEMEGAGKGEQNKDREAATEAGLRLLTSRHGNLSVASSDDSLKGILETIKLSKKPAVVNYGASWCRVCGQILPAFYELSNEFKNLAFVYADIDECPETTLSIRYTPTFHFYRSGERVDEMLGGGEERLHDRLWLHS